MAWSLKIHHIGLDGKGDATLIIAENDGVGANQQVQARTMLIDGGLHGEHAFLDAYVTAQLGALLGGGGSPLNVMVVTHYDSDHYNGIRGLLTIGGAHGAANIYDNTIIFDQGYSEGSNSNEYIYYTNAIALRGARARVTRHVLGLAPFNPLTPPAPVGGWGPSNQILGQEILWTDAAGANVTPANLLGAGVAVNTNQPIVTCIAVNQFVQGVAGRRGGLGADLKNEHSLGFVVQFNNFQYYIAGDLETGQENHVQVALNGANNLANRVVAIKASHHGGNTSTSRAFVDHLKPDAVFISCGNTNQHLHPSQEVVNVLGGYPWAAVAHVAAPPPSPKTPVSYYLTGFQNLGPPPTSLGEPNISLTSGDPNAGPPRVPGHIVLSVTEAQSNNDQRGETYFGIREATKIAAVQAGVPLANAAAIGLAAANSVAAAGINTRLDAVQAAVQAAATAAGAAAGVVMGALIAATNEATGVNGNIYNAQTIANHTATQALPGGGGTPVDQMRAAVAGAAAGAAFASGQRNAACLAVLQALNAVGLGLFPMAAIFPPVLAAIGVAVGPGLFDVTYYESLLLAAPGFETVTHTG